jgi:hypothetical protein
MKLYVLSYLHQKLNAALNIEWLYLLPIYGTGVATLEQ